MIFLKQKNTGNLYFSEKLENELKKIQNYPLTIIEAPMGYGKTTAVKEYLIGINAYTLWQSVYDGYVDNFWNRFCSLFQALDSECSSALLELGLPDDSISMEEAFRLIINIQFSKLTCIVIDDYHHIDNSNIHNFLVFLIKNEIPNLNIIILTRLCKMNEIDELKLKGYAHYIDKTILEFNAQDIGKYYKTCGITAKAKELDKVRKFTEGWISAIYLIMLDYKTDYESGVKNYFELPSTVKSIYSLLEKSIYLQLTQEMQEFLVTMCVFDCFTVEQSQFMWRKTNAHKLLEDIVFINLFLTYDSHTNKYQMHNILKNYLNEVLDRKDQQYQREINLKAAQWFHIIGDYSNAMSHYYEAKDFNNLLTICELDKGKHVDFEHKDLLKKFFSECPSDIKLNHPIAVLVYILNLFVLDYNEVELFQKECNEFIRSVRNNAKLDQKTKLWLEGEFEVILGFTAYNSVKGMSVHHRKAEKLMNGTCSFINNDGEWTFGSPSVLCLFHREAGKLEEMVADFLESMPYYYRLSNDHGYGAEYAVVAERYFHLGNYENAAINAHIADHMATKEYQNGVFLCVMFLQIRLAMVAGEFSQMLELFHKMKETIPHRKRYLYSYTYDICEAYVFACMNQKNKIPLWILNGEIDSPRILFQAKTFVNITYGRVLLIKGEYLKLIGMSECFMQTASVFSNTLGIVYTHIYVCAANNQILRDAEALASLKKALDLVIVDKLYLPFVENCDFIKSILEQLQRDELYRTSVREILELYKNYEVSMNKMNTESSIVKKPKLTERELEIAEITSKGFSNKEIAEKLFISTNTVKTQLKNIFDKLEIKSRTQLKSYMEVEGSSQTT